MAEEADVSLEEAIAQVVARMVKLAHDLARTKVHEDHDWFRNMLVGILISTYQNYQAVLAGVPQQPTLACWGARNLLELRVITTYVLRSLDNAVDFIDDLAADTREFWENIGKVGRFTHNELITEMRATAMGEDGPLKSLLLRKATEEEQAGPGAARTRERTSQSQADDDSFRRRSHSETEAGISYCQRSQGERSLRPPLQSALQGRSSYIPLDCGADQCG